MYIIIPRRNLQPRLQNNLTVILINLNASKFCTITTVQRSEEMLYSRVGEDSSELRKQCLNSRQKNVRASKKFLITYGVGWPASRQKNTTACLKSMVDRSFKEPRATTPSLRRR